MKVTEKVGKNNSYVVVLEDYYGSGYSSAFYEAIKNKVAPQKIKKVDVEVSLGSSEYEIFFTKDTIEVKVEIDDFGPVAFILKENVSQGKEKVYEWATNAGDEVAKLQ